MTDFPAPWFITKEYKWQSPISWLKLKYSCFKKSLITSMSEWVVTASIQLHMLCVEQYHFKQLFQWWSNSRLSNNCNMNYPRCFTHKYIQQNMENQCKPYSCFSWANIASTSWWVWGRLWTLPIPKSIRANMARWPDDQWEIFRIQQMEVLT